MSKKKPPPAVALHSVFVRDHQRRLRLVIDLLELEARRQRTPPTNSQSQSELETPRAFTATQRNPGWLTNCLDRQHEFAEYVSVYWFLHRLEHFRQCSAGPARDRLQPNRFEVVA